MSFETLEDMLRMKVSTMYKGGSVLRDKHGFEIEMSPEFRVAVQEITDDGVRVILHANGHDSDTFDLLIKDNTIEMINHCK